MPPTYPVAALWAGLQSRLLATLTGSTGSGWAHRSHPNSAAPSTPGLSWRVGRGSSSQPLSFALAALSSVWNFLLLQVSTGMSAFPELTRQLSTGLIFGSPTHGSPARAFFNSILAPSL